LAQRIPGARYVELPGDDHLPFVGDQDEIIKEIEDFLNGIQENVEPDRVLATFLFASISQTGLKKMEDSQIDSFQKNVRKELARFRGREIDTGKETFLAAFDGPARAIRSAQLMSDLAKRFNLELQIGLHTGECDAIGDRFQGVAVDAAAQIATRAKTGEILVSSTVKDLVAGSGITFEDRGLHTLNDEERRLFAATL
jgi:class 3 adenylate cyclase